jgi:hypothetical protein
MVREASVVVKDNANKNSFQEKINTKMAEAIKPGADRGRIIL